MEGLKINETGYETFIEAFQVAYTMFFVMNLEYPKKMGVTFEMIQRYFLKIHPDAGTKAKRIPRSKQRVINFINTLKKWSN